MTQRTCSQPECDRPAYAKGLCGKDYTAAWRKAVGRNRQAEYFDRTCVVCATAFRSARPTGKFCSDACKGRHYTESKRTKCKLPDDHPVRREMKRQVEQRRAEREAAKRSDFSWRIERECPGCACWFTPLYTPTAVCCSKRCAKRMSRQRRRAREHNAAGEFTWSEFMRIAARFDYCCAYCGTKPERLDPDHVVPLSRGGSNMPSNLLPTCFLCNSSKCAMTLA